LLTWCKKINFVHLGAVPGPAKNMIAAPRGSGSTTTNIGIYFGHNLFAVILFSFDILVFSTLFIHDVQYAYYCTFINAVILFLILKFEQFSWMKDRYEFQFGNAAYFQYRQVR
jgi:Ca2+/Na+ antiporter